MKRLTIPHGEIAFYGKVLNKCSNLEYPPIKKQIDEGIKSCDIKGYDCVSYSEDELRAIYARLAELEDKLESGELGNVEQAVKEFAEKLKTEFKQKYPIIFGESAIKLIDEEIKKSYGVGD